MNILDIVMIIILAWGAFRGFTQGFILQVVTFIALIIGIWASIKFSGVMAGFLTDKLDITGKYLPVLSFVLVFILVVMLAHLVGWLLTRFFELTPLGWLNRIGGIAFGILKMAFIISVLFAVQDRVKDKVKIIPDKQKETSLLYKPVAGIAPALFPYLKFKNLEMKLKELTPDI
ncbi:MAG: CvpA family protein [Bacteroidetes bacterium]|nr:CvpA family protein [Bacteroidota bacterium]